MINMVKRSGIFYIALCMAFIGLIFRCFWLAGGKNAAQAETAVAKRERSLVLYRTKGRIYDDSMIPLAGGQKCIYIVVNPREIAGDDQKKLIEISGEKAAETKENLKKEAPFIIKTNENPQITKGVWIFEGEERYSGVAKHLLGYLDSADEVGLSGVEKEYNDFLSLFASEISVRYRSDAMRGALAGLGMEIQGEEVNENGIVLSLNRGLCEAVEELMENRIEKGAVVVTDCRSGEIKAMVSKPNYDEDKIVSYLQSDNGELINRALTSQAVGSVFKLVIAAAALEAGLEGFKYQCDGGILIKEHTFSCNNHTPAKEMDLREALAGSCNSYFIALGQILGYDRIINTARRCGFGEKIEIAEKIEASAGRLKQEGGALGLANLSIGQGELTATPLHINQLMTIISNNGLLPATKLYRGLWINGALKAQEEAPDPQQILDSDIAEKLREYCVYAVENGTGNQAKPNDGGAGGKTSSAQTGIIENGEEKLNVYFAGFYPADQPRYTITVFAEDGISGGKTCGPIFREICNYIGKNFLTV